MISSIISRLVILVFGTLYPAYASYKAVRTKNLKEYVKWMMYWIVFALFTCTETFTDVFLSWFPFYYEVKIVLVLWLLSPATKGSSILYRKFVHPALCRREQEIDEYIAKAKDQGYHTVLNLGTKGVNYATTVIMQTAIKGGGGLVQQLRKSYSLSDLTECEPREERGSDEADDVMTEPRLIRRGAKSHIKSTEDISSGYSSADNSASLTRTASLGASARARARTTRTTVTTIKRPQAAEESEVIIEELQDDDTFEYANMPPLVNLPSPVYLSHTNPPFLYQYVGNQVKIIQVIGNYSLNTSSNNKTNDSDIWDQKEATTKEASLDNNKEVDQNQIENKVDVVLNAENEISPNIPVTTDQKVDDQTVKNENNEVLTENNENKMSDELILKNDVDNNEITNTQSGPNINIENLETVKEDIVTTDEYVEMISFEMALDNNDSAESDDEASFGTPDDSPKSKRRSSKGKYGKSKAPPPPKQITSEDNKNDSLKPDDKVLDSTTSQESLVDIVNKMPNITIKESGMSKGLQVVNPIAEKKRRHKTKSPGRIPKSSSSGLGKLLQLPSKLAFWHRNDDTKTDNDESTSSDERSRRSSDQAIIDEFQSCADLNVVSDVTNNDQIETQDNDDKISFIDAELASDSENITQDIIDKSDALQKLIEAKLQSNPEYKYVPLHEEIPTTSKCTDV